MLLQAKNKKEVPSTSLLELCCHVDDFWRGFEPQWRQEQLARGQRLGELCPMEITTIVIQFHQSR